MELASVNFHVIKLDLLRFVPAPVADEACQARRPLVLRVRFVDSELNEAIDDVDEVSDAFHRRALVAERDRDLVVADFVAAHHETSR